MNKILILTIALLIIGCGAADKTEKNKKTKPVISEQTEMQRASSILITNFIKELKTELMKGVKEGGVENAIGACQLKAPEITTNFTTKNWSVKRVTNKPRNQLNQANEHEQNILELFADSLKKLDFFDEWKDVGNKKDYYFYKPIYMGKFCLKCHGTNTNIDEKTVAALKEKYPEDKAVDYAESDLRGMFVVQIGNYENSDSLIEIYQDSLK